MVWIAGLLFLVLCVIIVGIVLKISSQVNDRLSQMDRSLQDANRIIGHNLGNATNIFGSVQESLGRLEGANRQIIEISKDIASLQDILRAPKLRGQIGETLLENLLSQVLPKEYFQMQYRFRSLDTVDAVIRLGGRLVPVDAKFSLENFQKMAQAGDEAAKNAFRKKFIQDIKNRIDEIAAKYILPQEDTYDFAFMYIPAENIYYEMAIKEDLFSYCVLKKVIPVSPNTFYAYLQVVCMGLKGLKIEENAKEILKNLSMLSNEIIKFKDDFGLLGTHLKNASTKFDDSQKRLDRFSDKLLNIQDSKQLPP
jgi:DNA recombination protein RmuC